MIPRVLTERDLNRGLLARQLLLERASLTLADAIEQVGGLQTQYAPSGYVGLWTRLARFDRDALTRALEHVRAGALELHPIIVTFAFLLGAQLAGAIGAIVAIPLAAVVQAFVVRYFEQYRAQRGWPGPDDIGAPEDDVGAAGAAAPSELSSVAAPG